MADELVLKKPRMGAKKSKGHKGKRQSHNKDTQKYSKQRFRTSQNKAKNIAKAKSRKKPDMSAGQSKPQSEYRKKK